MGYKQPSSGLPFKEMGSSPPKNGKKTMHPMEAIKQVDPGYMDKSYEKDIYKSKLRGDYQDLTGDKLKKASVGDPTGTVVSKDPEGPITGN